jgi:hypothetical protein
MSTFSTRRVVIRNQAMDLWESPDGTFGATSRDLARYAAAEDWVAVFNVLTLWSTPLRAE